MKASLNQQPIKVGIGRALWIIKPAESFEIRKIPKVLTDDHQSWLQITQPLRPMAHNSWII